ncbi:HET-domain-containing protein [Nemania abortiva]|nr:HET-domain-containing protein [Nemania abortiva]
MTTFEYQSLDVADRQIRLLNLLPEPGRVRCDLRHVSLSKIQVEYATEEYETLSYCWGKQADRSVEIIVNDRIFSIAPNLYAALLRLRPLDSDCPRTLWIDAICINQSDAVEKNAQISLMGDIYSSCRRVLIWIGEHDALTSYAFRALTFMASRSKTGQKFNYFDWKQVQRRESSDGLQRQPRFAWTLDGLVSGAAFNALFSRPWFRRVWVIQEVVLPPDAVVVCGKFQISWHLIAKAQEISKTNFEVNNHLGTILRFRDWPEDLVNDIFSYLLMASHQEATNPRDKIYGLSGIEYLHRHKALVEVDYEAGISQIFIDFTKKYLERTSNMQVLAICRGCKENDSLDSDYPSWAINPAFEGKNEPLPRDLISWGFVEWKAYPRGFSAGGTVPCKPSLDGNLLGIPGFQFDSVKECGPVNSPGAARYKETDVSPGNPFWRSTVAFCSIYLRGGFASWKSAISFCQFYIAAKKIMQETGLGEIYHPTGQATLDAFWQVISGRNLPIDHPDAEASARKQFEDFDKMLSHLAGRAANTPLSVATITREILGNPACMELFPLINITKHRRFFVTEKGYMGLGPRETAVGDSAIILQGHQAPILARGVQQKRWKVVGDSYVHGMMEGEAFADETCEPLWFE